MLRANLFETRLFAKIPLGHDLHHRYSTQTENGTASGRSVLLALVFDSYVLSV